MNFELSRSIEQIASLETENTKLERALSEMNKIVAHQINEPLSDGKKHFFHPLTCGKDSGHTLLFPFWTSSAVVLKCPDCDYTQAFPTRMVGGTVEDDSDVGC